MEVIIDMKHLKNYYYPSSIEEALSLLTKEHTDIIAGGTHLLTAKSQSTVNLVDISRIGLNYIKKEGEKVNIGSTTTITEMIESPTIKEIGDGILTKACQLIADTPLRNLITLGGNIARRYPWAGLPVVLLVLDAEIVIIEQGGKSLTVPASQWFGSRKLKKDEIISEVIFPVKRGWFCVYEKFALTTADYSWLTMAFSTNIEEGMIIDPHIAVSRIIKAKRIEEVEKYLDGQTILTLDLDEAAIKLKQAVNIVSDYRSSKEYREHLLGVLFKRMLKDLKKEVK